jgi:8-oxo-dGTP pyrophosphatase MutT (NUDIX family)
MADQLPDNKIKYSIRVYMLILNNDMEILLSDEYRLGMKMVKFPGGGMEYGEGTVDCLQREAMEEFGQELANIRHFYTTDYYQKAYFFNDHQLISIYYLADLTEELRIRVSDKAFDFPEMKNGQQSFRRVHLSDIREEDLSFPIDRKVTAMLKKEFLRDL